MAEIERFDVWRQRMALTELAESIDFLGTAEGAAFMEQLAAFFAPAVVGAAHRMGYPMDHDDVVNGGIVLLTADDGRIARYAAAADSEPWAYMGMCLQAWVRQQWGHRGTSLDAAEFLAVTPPVIDPGDFTPLEMVVQLTWETLCPLTPNELHPELRELLGWLAVNPPQRLSYEGADKRAAHRQCPQFTIWQVTAVINIAWGGRPRQAESSLMGQFLLDPQFHPSDSPTHARALTYYKKQMIAGAASSKMLSDWGKAL